MFAACMQATQSTKTTRLAEEKTVDKQADNSNNPNNEEYADDNVQNKGIHSVRDGVLLAKKVAAQVARQTVLEA